MTNLATLLPNGCHTPRISDNQLVNTQSTPYSVCHRHFSFAFERGLNCVSALLQVCWETRQLLFFRKKHWHLQAVKTSQTPAVYWLWGITGEGAGGWRHTAATISIVVYSTKLDDLRLRQGQILFRSTRPEYSRGNHCCCWVFGSAVTSFYLISILVWDSPKYSHRCLFSSAMERLKNPLTSVSKEKHAQNTEWVVGESLCCVVTKRSVESK